MSSLEKYIQEHLESLHTRDQHRELITYSKTDSTTIQPADDNRTYIAFNDNDYFNLSTHPDVISAIIQTTKSEGMGIRASRLVTGNNPQYTALETLLAQMKQTEAALVFGSGYLTHIGIIPALVGKGDLIIADKYMHASMIDAARLSGATCLRFLHNNLTSCRILLERYRHQYRHCIILTETIFSMDGDTAPLAGLSELAKIHDALLVSDDAHGTGFFMENPLNNSHLHMGTLSKALGSYGGYVCGSKVMMDYLTNTARSLIYSTALPAPLLAGAYAALNYLKNNINLSTQLIDKAKYFTDKMKISEARSPIVPYIVHSSQRAIALSRGLKEKGLLVPAIRPPTVPRNTARLRITFCLSHTQNQIDHLINSLKELTDYE